MFLVIDLEGNGLRVIGALIMMPVVARTVTVLA
jgi:hypothetical protein